MIKRLVTAGLLVGMLFAPSAVPFVFAQNEYCSGTGAQYQACQARNQRAQEEERQRRRDEAQRQRERYEDQARQDQQRREDQARRDREARQRR